MNIDNFTRRYQVTMSTPIGKKRGAMTVTVNGGTLSGTLELLGHAEPFTGTVEVDGSCNVKGTFVTLRHTFPYTADGFIGVDFIRVTLRTERYRFELYGESEGGA